MNLKARQHYIWQAYLSRWATDDLIWCNRRNKVFRTGLVNIGVEKFFYKIPSLNKSEYQFLKAWCQKPSRPEVQPFIDSIVASFYMPSMMKNAMSAISTKDAKGLEIVRELEVNGIENVLANIEQEAIVILQSIAEKNFSFMHNLEQQIKFIQYICITQIRTKKTREIFIKEVCPSIKQNPIAKDIKIERLWLPKMITFAYQIAFGILNSEPKIKILVNDTKVPFITSDQPVFNICAIGKAPNKIVQKMEYYHPISPNIAITLSCDYPQNQVIGIGNKEDVQRYNNMVATESLEQVYGSTGECVESVFYS